MALHPRGLTNAEQLSLNIATLTASGVLVDGPCYLWSLDVTLSAEAAGTVRLVNKAASGGSIVADGGMDITSHSATGGGDRFYHWHRDFKVPLHFDTGIFVSATGLRSIMAGFKQ